MRYTAATTTTIRSSLANAVLSCASHDRDRPWRPNYPMGAHAEHRP
jgi:hypothetical protein